MAARPRSPKSLKSNCSPRCTHNPAVRAGKPGSGEAHRDRIAQWLTQGLRLSKLRKLLLRHGVSVPYATLHRFAVAELGFGRCAATVPIADCAPGTELQVDTGWMGALEPGNREPQRARVSFPVKQTILS